MPEGGVTYITYTSIFTNMYVQYVYTHVNTQTKLLKNKTINDNRTMYLIPMSNGDLNIR